MKRGWDVLRTIALVVVVALTICDGPAGAQEPEDFDRTAAAAEMETALAEEKLDRALELAETTAFYEILARADTFGIFRRRNSRQEVSPWGIE